MTGPTQTTNKFTHKARTDGLIKALELAGVDGFTKDVVKLNLLNADALSHIRKLENTLRWIFNDSNSQLTAEACNKIHEALQ